MRGVTVSPFLGLNARKREAWGLPHVSSSSDAATFQAAGRTSLFLRAFSPELEGFVFFGLRAACCRYRGASLLASKFDRRTGSPTTPIRPQKLSSRLLRRKAAAGCSSPRCFAPKCPNRRGGFTTWSHAPQKRLKKVGLIEGRRPNLFVSARVAQATNDRAAYIMNRGLDKEH